MRTYMWIWGWNLFVALLFPLLDQDKWLIRNLFIRRSNTSLKVKFLKGYYSSKWYKRKIRMILCWDSQNFSKDWIQIHYTIKLLAITLFHMCKHQKSGQYRVTLHKVWVKSSRWAKTGDWHLLLKKSTACLQNKFTCWKLRKESIHGTNNCRRKSSKWIVWPLWWWICCKIYLTWPKLRRILSVLTKATSACSRLSKKHSTSVSQVLT